MEDALRPLADAASQAHWADRAAKVLPAGGFGNFDPSIFIRRGEGARVWDEDGNEYVDLLIGSGPMILGHGHPEVDDALRAQLRDGLTFFANNARGVELAEEVCRAMPCAEQVRYVSTGGEADMYAMRIARAHTGRTKILKFEGGYHGMSAEALMSLSPARLENFPLAVPDSAGIPDSVREEIIVAPFNDADFARQLIHEHADEIAAVIVEPFQRILPPEPGFLEALRAATAEKGIVLIFDEVVTGFRFAYGGAQELYGVTPDLCTLGKIAGGGLPLAAVAGKAEIMAHFDKSKVGEAGFTFQIGTLSGNPLAAAAGLKTLEILRRPGAYDALRAKGDRIMAVMREALTEAGVPFTLIGDPTLFEVVFVDGPVVNYRDVKRGDPALAKRYNQSMRASGILKPDSKSYISLALTETDLDQVSEAVRTAARAL